MSDPKKPPAPRVPHRVVQQPSGGARGPGDDQTNPEDLLNPLVADHLLGSLPDKMFERNGQFFAATGTAAPEPQVEGKDQVVDRVTLRINTSLKTKADDAPGALGEGLELALLQNEIDPEAVQVTLPFNSKMIRAGGYAVLDSLQKVRDAAVMKVNAVLLGVKLAQAERIRRLRAVITPIDAILAANESIVLNDIDKIVNDALRQGWSTIQNNGALLRLLAAALAIRQDPADQAQQTKADNQRREEAVRADEQHKAQGQTGAAPQQQITGTLTTQGPPPPMGTAGPQPAQPMQTGHGNKPAK